MKMILAAAVLTLGAALAPAQAAGCLKGAAVGGVGGHFLGHHGLMGAAAGCAVGHHEAAKHARQAAAAQPAGGGTAPVTGTSSAPE